jgi:hypothetical protein
MASTQCCDYCGRLYGSVEGFMEHLQACRVREAKRRRWKRALNNRKAQTPEQLAAAGDPFKRLIKERDE